MRVSRWLAGLAALAFVAAACGDSGDSSGANGGNGGNGEGGITPTKTYDTIGEGEGSLNLIAWAGYAEDGSNDKNYDWVTPFEDETGCKVEVKYANTSDEMVTLMRQGGGSTYDGVSASGDATNRLIVGGVVGAVDPKLFTGMADVIAPLAPGGEKTGHYIVGDAQYGVPYMYGPNFLMYNTNEVKPAPDSWDITWEPDSPFAGKITGYDSAIYIADAALYLKTHNPDLGITDPYELSQEQLDAAVELLKGQSALISKYWALYTDEIDGFVDGSMVAGTAWPLNLSLAEADAPLDAVIPSEGVTGWADTWMISANAPHPNCMLRWMDYTLRPDVQAEVAVWYGAAGSNAESCDQIRTALGKDADLVDTVRYGFCGDAEFLNSIYTWKTPSVDCGDDRGTTCMDYSVWQQKWTEIRGS